LSPYAYYLECTVVLILKKYLVEIGKIT